MHGWRLADVSELRVGDPILVVCDEILKIFRTDQNKVTGRIISIFDASGKSGPCWQIEIRLPQEKWWMYEPQKYGGEIYLVQK